MKHEKPMVTIELKEYENLLLRSKAADKNISTIMQYSDSYRYSFLNEGDKYDIRTCVRITEEFTEEQSQAILHLIYSQVCKWGDTHIDVALHQIKELSREQAETISREAKQSIREKIKDWFKFPDSVEKGGVYDR